MTVPECPREQDVITAIRRGSLAGPVLRNTVTKRSGTRRAMRDLQGTRRGDEPAASRTRRTSRRDERAGRGSGLVARRDSRETRSVRAGRPPAVVGIRDISCLCRRTCCCGRRAAVVAISTGGRDRWPPAGGRLPLGLGEVTRLLPSLTDLPLFTTTGVFVLLGAAACLLLAPLALYFALSDE